MLTKTQRVLDRSVVVAERATFVQQDEETGTFRTLIHVDAETYGELGEPDQITLTIEPGDLLNPPEESE